MNSVVFFGTSSRSKVLSCFRPSMGGGGAALMRELSCELKLGRTGSVGGLRMGGLGIASPAPLAALPLLLMLTRADCPEASIGGGGGTRLRELPAMLPEASRGGGGGTV